MKNAELKEAIAKYIESKELVLMGYSPEYIDDVKNDMEVAFQAGAEWMAEQGITLECLIDYKSGALVGIDSVPTQETLKDYCNKIGASRVIVQIRKKQ